MPRHFFILLSFAICTALPCRSQIQRPESFASEISIEELSQTIDILTDKKLSGRETGTIGASDAAIFISEKMHAMGLQPMGSGNPLRTKNTYTQSFLCPNGRTGRNVIGWIPASDNLSNQTLIITAHYDHLGTIDGVMYPGADSNASGVAVLLTIAKAFAKIRESGGYLYRNLMFVCYDAKEFSLWGARYFAGMLALPKDQILLNLNIDQIGTTFEPPAKEEAYALILGTKSVSPAIIQSFLNSNSFYNTNLDIDCTFYGSPVFEEVFLEMNEQHFLAEEKVPSLLVTSGVNDYSYKKEDTPDKINYPVLLRRTLWLYYSLWDLVQKRIKS